MKTAHEWFPNLKPHAYLRNSLGPALACMRAELLFELPAKRFFDFLTTRECFCAFSNNKWHQRLHLFLISRIVVRKMPQQKPFLLLELDPKGGRHQRQG